MIRQLIFDCDGVLVDSEIIAAQIMVELLNEHNIPITIHYYLNHCSGKTFSGLIRDLPKKFDSNPLPDNFLDLIMTTHDSKVKKELKPVAGIPNALEQINYPKAVVSNSDLYQIQHAVDVTGIKHHFNDNLFSSEMVSKPKPAPDIYLFAAEKLNVAVEQCLVIEDSLSGATAALEAGMNVIGFTAGTHIVTGHKEKLLYLGVSSVAEDGKELVSQINNF